MADIKQFEPEMKAARQAAARSGKKFLASDIHGILADWLEDRDDPRYVLVRNRMGRATAQKHAVSLVRPSDQESVSGSQMSPYRFNDGSKLVIDFYWAHRLYLNDEYKNVVVHLRWEALPRVWYDAVMNKDQFNDWIRSFPEPEKTRLLATFQNYEQTRKDESRSFKEWVKRNKNEAFIVGNPSSKDCHNPDFNVAGAVCMKKKRKKI